MPDPLPCFRTSHADGERYFEFRLAGGGLATARVGDVRGVSQLIVRPEFQIGQAPPDPIVYTVIDTLSRSFIVDHPYDEIRDLLCPSVDHDHF